MSVIRLCPSCFSIHDWSKPCSVKAIEKGKSLLKKGMAAGTPDSHITWAVPAAGNKKPDLDFYDRYSR